MDTFYSFYTKNFGKISDNAFNLFWTGNYEKCLKLYEQIIASTGSIETMGFNDTLIYHHCSTQLGSNVLENIEIPAPPTREEVLAIYNYEQSQEKQNTTRSRKGLLSQPKVLSKAILAARIGIKNDCEEVIETGTFLGSSSYIFSGIFAKVDTIEADQLLHESASKLLKSKTKNVNCHLGNSGEKLAEILTTKREKQLIFLDAHYSTGITSKEYGICPLEKELEILMSHSEEHIVVIDDIRCMGDSGYPSTKQILDRIPEGRLVTIQYDQMVII